MYGAAGSVRHYMPVQRRLARLTPTPLKDVCGILQVYSAENPLSRGGGPSLTKHPGHSLGWGKYAYWVSLVVPVTLEAPCVRVERYPYDRTMSGLLIWRTLGIGDRVMGVYAGRN